MSIYSIIALSLLVLLAGGFYVGRARALRSAGVALSSLHSLPNYHGYYVALWTGLPAFLTMLAFALLSQDASDRIVSSRLVELSAPLQSAYETAMARDQEHADLSGLFAQLRARSERLSDDIQRLRSLRGSARDPDALQALQEEHVEVLNLITTTQAALEDRSDLIANDVRAAPETGALPEDARAGFVFWIGDGDARRLFLGDARNIAQGVPASRHADELNVAAQMVVETDVWIRNAMIILVYGLALTGFFYSRGRVGQSFRARNGVEALIIAFLFLSSVIAILTTIGIVASLLFESMRFFSQVSIWEFLFGLHWSPQIAIRADQVGQTGAFGAVPLFAGTALITLIAMIVAIPIGLFSAIYLSEYAGSKFRQTAKPVLEILAGIPTVVYGFFALLTVGPAIRTALAALGFEDVVTQSAFSAGLVMGVMIIPFISSLSDDVINAVPQALRDGSYAMGATRSETIRQVVLPAALPGIVGAILLAVSRAVGETMIVVMAAGQGANLTANPLEAVTTITVQIVMLLTGDQEFNSVKTLSAFALGLVLFVLTLIMNMIALRVVQKYREKYD
ncbi:MAG: phosphate ABC transporter permease subunit PstC [Alphaproteobacteria bacterium]|nr:phosphate ABC transporter permease subunit PstC [Alphaproteobacteria bacterium]